MVNDPLHGVPALRADDKPDRLVPTPAATLRDLRWLAHPLRGTLGGLFWLMLLGLTWLNMDFLDRSTLVVDLLMVAVVVWWGTGLFSAAHHTVRMGRRMGEVCSRAMAVYRALPTEERVLSRDAAVAMLRAGERHEVDVVRTYVGTFERLTLTVTAGNPYPGYLDPARELAGWTEGAEEVRQPD